MSTTSSGSNENDQADRVAEIRSQARRLSHDMRNALNGIAVNLEAARGRVGELPNAERVEPLLGHAARQIDVATAICREMVDLIGDALEVGSQGGERKEHRSA